MVVGGTLGALTSLFNRARLHKRITVADVAVHFGIASCLLFVAWAICDIWQIAYVYRKVVYYSAGWFGPYVVSAVDACVKRKASIVVDKAVDKLTGKMFE